MDANESVLYSMLLTARMCYALSNTLTYIYMYLQVLWSPSSPSETLTERDLIVDYPELTKL